MRPVHDRLGRFPLAGDDAVADHIYLISAQRGGETVPERGSVRAFRNGQQDRLHMTISSLGIIWPLTVNLALDGKVKSSFAAVHVDRERDRGSYRL